MRLIQLTQVIIVYRLILQPITIILLQQETQTYCLLNQKMKLMCQEFLHFIFLLSNLI